MDPRHAHRAPHRPRDDIHLVPRHAANIHLDVQSFVHAELRAHSPRNDVQILKSVQNARDGAGIRVSNDAETKD